MSAKMSQRQLTERSMPHKSCPPGPHQCRKNALRAQRDRARDQQKEVSRGQCSLCSLSNVGRTKRSGRGRDRRRPCRRRVKGLPAYFIGAPSPPSILALLTAPCSRLPPALFSVLLVEQACGVDRGRDRLSNGASHMRSLLRHVLTGRSHSAGAVAGPGQDIQYQVSAWNMEYRPPGQVPQHAQRAAAAGPGSTHSSASRAALCSCAG